jgi:hypothetical protein
MAAASKAPARKILKAAISDNGSVSVRKIANGYIVTESKSTARSFTSKETFSPSKPKIEIG